MERFFFNLVYPADVVADPEGSDCASLEAAKIEARAILREIIAERLSADPIFEPSGIHICTRTGKQLALVSAAEAVGEIVGLENPPAPPPGGC